MLLRASPAPSWAVNYCLALTRIPFHTFAAATALGGSLTIIQNVYLGSLGSSFTSAYLSGDAGGPATAEVPQHAALPYFRYALSAVSLFSFAYLSKIMALEARKLD
jgi:uncharacterized membrane protein YdjX (TVP38/TMEM64 family)